jgi:hypothetical protein
MDNSEHPGDKEIDGKDPTKFDEHRESHADSITTILSTIMDSNVTFGGDSGRLSMRPIPFRSVEQSRPLELGFSEILQQMKMCAGIR